MIEATRKKLREAGFFLRQLIEEESRIQRLPEPEARDFYLSAFLSAGRSVGDFINAEEGARYREWFAERRRALSDDERELLELTNDQRIQSVHVAGPNVQSNVTRVSMYELQREIEQRGGSLEIHPGGVPGSPLPMPEIDRTTLSFSRRPDFTVSEVCGRYFELLGRLLIEYEQFVGDHPSAA